MTEAQWALAAGLKRTGDTFQTYKSRLRIAGRIEQRGSLFYATDEGFLALGEMGIPVLPEPGPDLVAFWAERIPGAGPMLRHLAETWPVATPRPALAEALGLSASGGTFTTYLSRLRSAGLIAEPERGQVRITDALVCRAGAAKAP